jgi:hypothetical protein
VSREPETKSGLSIQTLVISSLSAVAAAIVVPLFWERGSLFATAVTPIVVAIVSEALSRPAKVISTAAPRVTKRAASRSPTPVVGRPEAPPPRWGPEEDPFGLRSEPAPKRSPVRIAVVTGLIGALIGAAAVTATELAIFGHQIGNPERSTGLLGGKPRRADPTPAPSQTTQPSPTATPERTATPTATATPSPSASPSASPSPTVSPTETTTTPFEATPVPTP